MVLPKADQFLLRLEIVNVFDNKLVYSRSEPCEGCKAGQVLDLLKAMASGEEIQRVKIAKAPKKKSNFLMYALGIVLVGGLAAAAGGGGGGGNGGGGGGPTTGNIKINW
jgi:hypothetical protein